MAELEYKVQPINVDFQCPICLVGRLRPTGRILYSDPRQYPHECNNPECEYKETFFKTYPYIDYKPL